MKGGKQTLPGRPPTFSRKFQKPAYTFGLYEDGRLRGLQFRNGWLMKNNFHDVHPVWFIRNTVKFGAVLFLIFLQKCPRSVAYLLTNCFLFFQTFSIVCFLKTKKDRWNLMVWKILYNIKRICTFQPQFHVIISKSVSFQKKLPLFYLCFLVSLGPTVS